MYYHIGSRVRDVSHETGKTVGLGLDWIGLDWSSSFTVLRTGFYGRRYILRSTRSASSFTNEDDQNKTTVPVGLDS